MGSMNAETGVTRCTARATPHRRRLLLRHPPLAVEVSAIEELKPIRKLIDLTFAVNTLVVIFLLMPMSAVLGIVGYIYLPQFLMRIRRGRYSEFRDLSEVS